jgi:hypothetical protein
MSDGCPAEGWRFEYCWVGRCADRDGASVFGSVVGRVARSGMPMRCGPGDGLVVVEGDRPALAGRRAVMFRGVAAATDGVQVRFGRAAAGLPVQGVVEVGGAVSASGSGTAAAVSGADEVGGGFGWSVADASDVEDGAAGRVGEHAPPGRAGAVGEVARVGGGDRAVALELAGGLAEAEEGVGGDGDPDLPGRPAGRRRRRCAEEAAGGVGGELVGVSSPAAAIRVTAVATRSASRSARRRARRARRARRPARSAARLLGSTPGRAPESVVTAVES